MLILLFTRVKVKLARGHPAGAQLDTEIGRDYTPSTMAGPHVRGIQYLYEDEYLIAVDKPEGLAVIAPEGSRSKSLYDIVTDHIRRRNPKGRAAVVHRIDRDTSGLVLFAKDGRSKKALMDNWDEMVRERRYLAVVCGTMEAESGRIESYLLENKGGEVYETDARARGAKLAITEYRVLETGNGASLVELLLETGRKHQIRVQLASRGHPVLGDPKYGRKFAPGRAQGQRSRSADAQRLYLHAAGMKFIHPRDRSLVSLECAAPACFSAIFFKAKDMRKTGPRTDSR
jgi:23S rRNA pseudouridine1911/1915/1917 synthase